MNQEHDPAAERLNHAFGSREQRDNHYSVYRVVFGVGVLIGLLLGWALPAKAAGNGTWDVTITAPPDPYAASFAWGGAGGVCAAIEAWANGWGTGASSCSVSPDGCTVTFHAANGSNPAGWDYQGVEQECDAEEPGGVEYTATVPNPAPAAYVLSMVVACLMLVWWIVFK